MPAPHRTHYEILGVARSATPQEIQRAFDRLRAEMRKETAPPDPRRVVQLQAAYDVLSDEARREAYDEALREGPRRQSRHRQVVTASVAAAIVIVAGVTYFALRRTGGPPPRGQADIVADAAPAVGRLHAVDPSGRVQQLGLAFAIGDGVLACACNGLAPDMELAVRIGSREVPARPARVDASRGYCTLAAPGTGSWPLQGVRFPARAGDEVYAVRAGASGHVSLVAGTILRIASGSASAVVQVTGGAAAAVAGSPLLDTQGRVVAIGDGAGRYVAFDPKDGMMER
jgi:hypothetical protein